MSVAEGQDTDMDTVNVLGMSDDEFSNMDEAFLYDSPISEPDTDSADNDDDEPETDPEDLDEQDEDYEDEDDDQDAADSVDDADDAAEDDTDDESPDSDTQEKPGDFKHFYESVTAEFTANGRPMKVDKPEDIVRLMQMGANYNKKMASLKPGLKILKTLEKNGLMDEGKLNFLIDLDKRNPQAIARLVQEAKIDPMDIDLSMADGYEAPTNTVSDQEMALEEVLGELESSPTYQKTIRVVGGEWDDASKQKVAENPELLRVLDSHVANGVFDLISTEVERERALGRLTGFTDIEAYRKVGDTLYANGKFGSVESRQDSVDTPSAKPATTRKSEDSQRRKRRRRAASPSKPAATKPASSQEFNPLGMSDEEFAKQFDPTLM